MPLTRDCTDAASSSPPDYWLVSHQGQEPARDSPNADAGDGFSAQQVPSQLQGQGFSKDFQGGRLEAQRSAGHDGPRDGSPARGGSAIEFAVTPNHGRTQGHGDHRAGHRRSRHGRLAQLPSLPTPIPTDDCRQPVQMQEVNSMAVWVVRQDSPKSGGWDRIALENGVAVIDFGLQTDISISTALSNWRAISDKMPTLCMVTSLALPEEYKMQRDKYGRFTSYRAGDISGLPHLGRCKRARKTGSNRQVSGRGRLSIVVPKLR